jgi:hypothetical protein
MEAGSNVMTLFRNRGWTAIIADLMVDTVLFMVSLGVGLFVGIVGLVVGAVTGMGDSVTLGVAFSIGFIIGGMCCFLGSILTLLGMNDALTTSRRRSKTKVAMCSTLFSVVSSGVNTVIVCYAEAPNEFQINHPDLSQKMRDSWRQAWPNEFGY